MVQVRLDLVIEHLFQMKAFFNQLQTSTGTATGTPLFDKNQMPKEYELSFIKYNKIQIISKLKEIGADMYQCQLKINEREDNEEVIKQANTILS